MMEAMTSSNIVANCAAALSDCVCFAEVANKADPRRTIALSYFETTLSALKNEKLRRYHTEKLAVGTKPRKWRCVGLLPQTLGATFKAKGLRRSTRCRAAFDYLMGVRCPVREVVNAVAAT